MKFLCLLGLFNRYEVSLFSKKFVDYRYFNYLCRCNQRVGSTDHSEIAQKKGTHREPPCLWFWEKPT